MNFANQEGLRRTTRRPRSNNGGTELSSSDSTLVVVMILVLVFLILVVLGILAFLKKNKWGKELLRMLCGRKAVRAVSNQESNRDDENDDEETSDDNDTENDRTRSNTEYQKFANGTSRGANAPYPPVAPVYTITDPAYPPQSNQMGSNFDFQQQMNSPFDYGQMNSKKKQKRKR